MLLINDSMMNSIDMTPETRKDNISIYSRSVKNIKKSVQMLDDTSTGPDKSILRVSTSKKMYVPSNISRDSFLDGSFLSPGQVTWTTFNKGNETTMTKNLFQNSTAIEASPRHDEFKHKEQDGNKLYIEFLEALQACPSTHQIFDLLEQYEKLVDEQVKMLMNSIEDPHSEFKKSSRIYSLHNLLKMECVTWHLIRTLYQDRLQTEAGESDSDAMLIDMISRRLSEKIIMQNLYARDAQVRQSQIVVDWLEKTAALNLDSNYSEKVEHFTSQTVAWENTLSYLMHCSTHNNAVNNNIVTEMDPDAPIRQKRQLDDVDRDDEHRTLRQVLGLVRAGQLEKAQIVCIKFGQPWRAATLEGWRLYHDPNYDNPSSAATKPIEGTNFRDVWKAVCWRMTEEERYSIYERALYAALSGNLKALLPVCITWEDYLWAYFRTMIDVRVEREIRAHSLSDRELEPLPSDYWNKELTPEIIFQELHASPNETVQASSNHPFHIMQKYIILNDINGLIEEMYEWVRAKPAISNQLVRFMAHLVLFFRSIGQNCKEELCNVILENYVQNLIDEHHVMLVSYYVAALPQKYQVYWYAKFLEGIDNREERQLCLQLAEDAGLNIPEITKLVVENIRNRNEDAVSLNGQPPSAFADLQGETTAEDLKKIDAIDWLMFDPAQRAEALRQANALMRLFLASKKLEAARAVFNKVPTNSISIITKFWQMQTGNDELPTEDDNASREYLCIHAYLQALESFNDWFDHYHHACPELAPLSVGASFTERVAYEHQEKQYYADYERWQHTVKIQTKTTVERLYNVLLFVDGGWMVDRYLDADQESSRTTQMQRLRELCLPQVASLLHNVLHTTQQYKACLQLADIITSEQQKLYKVFNKEELQNLLDRLRESSLCLLDQNLDPLGYPIK